MILIEIIKMFWSSWWQQQKFTTMSTMDDWAISLAQVPSDGSCFFSSIAVAFNRSTPAWTSNENIREKLRKYWHEYLALGLEAPDYFTPRYVRYMTSVNIDEGDLATYNETARADGKKTFRAVTSLADHVLHSNCWINSTTFGAFLKSLDCSVSVVVLDKELAQPLCVFDELTWKKELYICLWLEGYHYRPIQLHYRGVPQQMCVSRETIRMFMRNCYPDHKNKF